MRLSKTRKEEIQSAEHFTKPEIMLIRLQRKKANRKKHTIVKDETVRLNPKKDKSARKGKTPIPHNGFIFRNTPSSKYKPDSLITKKAK